MISGGAAFTFTMLALIVGYVAGAVVTGRDNPPADDQWGTINKAATEAYRRVSADIAQHRSMTLAEAIDVTLAEAIDAVARQTPGRRKDGGISVPSYLPRILLTSDAMQPGEMRLVDGDGFRALAGVDPQTVLNALGHRPMIRWGDPIPDWFTLA